MAQLKYRGNLSARVFPFLASQFGLTTIVQGQDQVNVFNGGVDFTSGDNNIPQIYYCHNVVPTAQGYKSVGYNTILPEAGIVFDRVIPIRDPDMVRGWVAVTLTGSVYMYRAGDASWTDVTAMIGGWLGGNVSIAYANGNTYLCLAGFNVFKLNTSARTAAVAVLNGIISTTIQAITSSSNYLILTDGVTVYWSSTIDPEDFIPSLVTGAGSLKPTDVEGLIVALIPLSNGFAVYTSVNCVIASYSQQARFPWIFRGADNSKGIANVQHVTSSSSDNGSNYAWTSAGIQKISSTGATTLMPELTDFLAGKQFEDFNYTTNKVDSQYLTRPMIIKVAFIGARYLVISYGITSLTHALVYDTSLKRWGKLKITHAACFELSLNTDGAITSSTSASAKKTLGFVSSRGEVKICNFDDGDVSADAVLILGKYQVIRSRMTTFHEIDVECVDQANTNFDLKVLSSFDGKNTDLVTTPTPLVTTPKLRQYASRVTADNHSLLFKGAFQLNSIMMTFVLNGKR